MLSHTHNTTSKPYYLGIGCRRGVPYDEMEQFISSTLLKENISWKQIHTIASCDLKSDEEALLQLAKIHNTPLQFYTAEQLNRITVPSPSLKVSQKIGSSSVSEAAALLASSGRLILPKQKSQRITVAIACTMEQNK